MKPTFHKQLFFLFAFLLSGFYFLQAQVKIGDQPAEISSYSLLELESKTKGLLLPRMTSQERDAAFQADAPRGNAYF